MRSFASGRRVIDLVAAVKIPNEDVMLQARLLSNMLLRSDSFP